LTLPFIESSNLLPIPFPRSFYHWDDNTFRLSERGLYSEYALNTKGLPPSTDFLGSMPSLLRTNYDSRYKPHVQRAVEAITTMKPAMRAQLSKDYMLEDDEIRGDVREKLSRLYEGIRMLETEEDSDEDGDG
jgi:hypothetical protein